MFENIAAELNERIFDAGETLLEEGKETPYVYILKEGALIVTIEEDEVCRVCTPEAVFGEISVLLDTESTATVKALEPTTVWVIDDLREFMGTHPAFALTVAEELARRLCNMNLNFQEVRTALQNLEDRFEEQLLGGSDAPVGRIDLERMALDNDSDSGIADQPDEMITVKRKQPIVIKGIMKKVDAALNDRMF